MWKCLQLVMRVRTFGLAPAPGGDWRPAWIMEDSVEVSHSKKLSSWRLCNFCLYYDIVHTPYHWYMSYFTGSSCSLKQGFLTDIRERLCLHCHRFNISSPQNLLSPCSTSHIEVFSFNAHTFKQPLRRMSLTSENKQHSILDLIWPMLAPTRCLQGLS